MAAHSARSRKSMEIKAPATRLAPVDRPRAIAFVRPATVFNRPRSGNVPAALRQQMIREAAYRRAEARDFAPGGDVSDWLAAEAEVDEIIDSRYRY
jgi:hypothetical protein